MITKAYSDRWVKFWTRLLYAEIALIISTIALVFFGEISRWSFAVIFSSLLLGVYNAWKNLRAMREAQQGSAVADE